MRLPRSGARPAALFASLVLAACGGDPSAPEAIRPTASPPEAPDRARGAAASAGVAAPRPELAVDTSTDTDPAPAAVTERPDAGPADASPADAPKESHAERARRRMWERTEERRRKKREARGKEPRTIGRPGGAGRAEGEPGDEAQDAPDTAADAKKPEGDPKTRGWKTYNAPNGAQFLHPPKWKVQETPGGLMIAAPGADPMQELIVGTAAPANGITDPTSRRAQTALDQLVRQSMPMLRRQGAPRALETGVGRGAVYDYSGRSPMGQDVQARVFAVIVDGTVGGFTLMAEPKLFGRRAADVERMFVSLSREKPDQSPPKAGDIDPRIAGKRFQGESVHSGDGIGITTQLVWAFNPDGTVLYGARTAMNASDRDHNGNLEWTATGVTEGSMERGRFTAKNGILEIRWDDGRRWRNAYGFEPDGSLVLRHPVTKKLINFYAPVR